MDPPSASNQSLQETDDYLFLDARAPRHVGLGMSSSANSTPGSGTGGTTGRTRRMAFNEGIVFVVGGAGYVEFGNLSEWAARAGKRMTYGGTEIVDPSAFVEILHELGRSRT